MIIKLIFLTASWGSAAAEWPIFQAGSRAATWQVCGITLGGVIYNQWSFLGLFLGHLPFAPRSPSPKKGSREFRCPYRLPYLYISMSFVCNICFAREFVEKHLPQVCWGTRRAADRRRGGPGLWWATMKNFVGVFCERRAWTSVAELEPKWCQVQIWVTDIPDNYIHSWTWCRSGIVAWGFTRVRGKQILNAQREAVSVLQAKHKP